MSSTDSQNTSIIQYLKTAFQDFYNGVPIACSDLRPFLITCTARLRETYTDYSTFLWLTLDVLAAEDQDAARSKLSAMTGNLGIGVPSMKTIVESICGLFRSVGTYSGMCAVAAVVGSKVLGLVALGAALLYGLSWIFSYCWGRGMEDRLGRENMENAEWNYEKKED